MSIFHSEDASKNLMTKISVMRIITQILRLGKEDFQKYNYNSLQSPSSEMAGSQNLIHTLNDSLDKYD